MRLQIILQIELNDSLYDKATIKDDLSTDIENLIVNEWPDLTAKVLYIKEMIAKTKSKSVSEF